MPELAARMRAMSTSSTASASPPAPPESSVRPKSSSTAAPSASCRDTACAQRAVAEPPPGGSIAAGFQRKAPQPGVSTRTSPRLLRPATLPWRPRQCAMRALQPPWPTCNGTTRSCSAPSSTSSPTTRGPYCSSNGIGSIVASARVMAAGFQRKEPRQPWLTRTRGGPTSVSTALPGISKQKVIWSLQSPWRCVCRCLARSTAMDSQTLSPTWTGMPRAPLSTGPEGSVAGATARGPRPRTRMPSNSERRTGGAAGSSRRGQAACASKANLGPLSAAVAASRQPGAQTWRE
mmetsp:Transcript_31389/g.97769  ORF Transcript_31389/g.97769 Transcript_31389/m.97769 type:complete len:291 (-) Transcript_31389:272-1144(-)